MTQTSLFDGPALRDRGIKRAVSHAEQKAPGWSEEALDMLKKFLQTKAEPFLTEEFRVWSHLHGLPKVYGRAFGGIMRGAAAKGLIRRIGYEETTNPNCHATPASLWVRV
jgi:hypothetical protein